MKKPTKPKKKNMQDATLINVRAVNKKLSALKVNIESLRTAQHEWIVHLLNRIRNLESGALVVGIKKLEAKKK